MTSGLFVLLGILFLCWGSFLNVVACRLIKGESIRGRSYCSHCHQTIAWYDLIPVLSWVLLAARCRTCTKPISWLYPFIEMLTLCVGFLLIYYVEPRYWFAYAIYTSALIVTIRTDFEHMLISRAMTLAVIPLALLLSTFNFLPISIAHSIFGALFGHSILWLIARIYYYLRNVEGMGQGDLDLLAMIGSFTGVTGVWWSLFVGSCLGSLVGIFVMIHLKKSQAQIAFGPWLAFGALSYIFFQNKLF